ncbi:MAG: hypothetical protein WCG25_08220 [bacterium]
MIHNIIITIQTISVITDIINGDILITDPNNHNNPHKIQNQIILPALNQKCGMIFFPNVCCWLFLFHLLDIASMSHHTTAIQLENHAVIQISNTRDNDGDHCDLISNENMPVLLSIKYNNINDIRLTSMIL